jgi:hypothetical protein
MRKLFAAILMVMYLIPAVGVHVSAHFCGGELSSVSHYSVEKQKCFCGSKKMGKGCCDDKQVTIKIDKQQKTEFQTLKFSNPIVALPSVPVTFQAPYTIKSIDRVDYDLFHPPNLYEQPIYLLNRVFRI